VRSRNDDPDENVRRRFAVVWPTAVARPPDEVAAWSALDLQRSDGAGRVWSAGGGQADPEPLDGAGERAEARRPGPDAPEAPPDGPDDGWSSPEELSGSGGIIPRAAGPDPAEEDARTSTARRSPRAILAGFDPGRRGVRALAVVAALVVLVAGFLAWRAQPRSEPVVAVSESARSVGGPVVVGPSGPSGPIVAAVQGKVRKPGLVRLPAGARVAEAIEAAGGVLPGVDLSFVNLARRVVDGELILVGVSPPPGVTIPGAAGGQAAPGSGEQAGPEAQAGVDAGGGADGKVNINRATAAELDGLPGVGPVLAARIVDYRTSHGGFRSVEELRQVSGIGDAKFAQLKDRVTV
jgi:competence protein ComEA